MNKDIIKRLAAYVTAVVAAGCMCFLTMPGLCTDSINASAVGNDIIKSGKCGENVYYELTADGTLDISGTGKTDNYNLNP